MALECRLTLEEPARDFEEHGWPVPREGKGRIDKRIGLNQCAIKVDAECGQDSGVEARDWAKSSPSFS